MYQIRRGRSTKNWHQLERFSQESQLTEKRGAYFFFLFTPALVLGVVLPSGECEVGVEDVELLFIEMMGWSTLMMGRLTRAAHARSP